MHPLPRRHGGGAIDDLHRRAVRCDLERSLAVCLHVQRPAPIAISALLGNNSARIRIGIDIHPRRQRHRSGESQICRIAQIDIIISSVEAERVVRMAGRPDRASRQRAVKSVAGGIPCRRSRCLVQTPVACKSRLRCRSQFSNLAGGKHLVVRPYLIDLAVEVQIAAWTTADVDVQSVVVLRGRNRCCIGIAEGTVHIDAKRDSRLVYASQMHPLPRRHGGGAIDDLHRRAVRCDLERSLAVCLHVQRPAPIAISALLGNNSARIRIGIDIHPRRQRHRSGESQICRIAQIDIIISSVEAERVVRMAGRPDRASRQRAVKSVAGGIPCRRPRCLVQAPVAH